MPDYNEADTCRRFITPKLIEAGWDKHPSRINQEYTFTDGRIQVYAGTGKRRASTQKRADYLLRYRKSFPIAVVEAKTHQRSDRDFESAKTRLRELLDGQEVLIMIDDVWKREHAEPFLRLGDHDAKALESASLHSG